MNHGCDAQALTRVVVTRPAPDHADLIQGVEALGLPSLHVPVHVLEPFDDQPQRLAALDDSDIAVVTSPATARFLLDRRAAEQLEHLVLIAPGAGTAAPLRAAGLSVFCPAADGTSEAVLALPELASIEGARVAILGAPGGRIMIAEQLADRGARVSRLYLYRRRAIAPDPKLFELLAERVPLAVLVSSVQIVGVLDAAIPLELRPQWRQALFICSSSRVQRCCRDHGLGRYACAGGASAVELLATLRQALQ
jgi:uroporphyrinogen-III synthase